LAPDVDQVASLAAAALDEFKIPGLSVAVMQGDELLLSSGYGRGEVARAAPVTAETVFQLGSIGKQFLAALVLRLAEQGSVSLDDAVTRHLPEFNLLSPQIRIRHLLNHTSGIREPFTMPAYIAGIEDLNRSTAELVAILQQAPVDFAPGSRWSYSNANYLILAQLVERVTGMPYERVLTREFFQPLGLTSLHQCTPLPQGSLEARGHVSKDGTPVLAAPENMNWIRGDGGLCAHALDLARWTRLLASGRVVTQESYHAMSAPARLSDGREVDYGFGLSLVSLDGRHKIAHNGAMLGFSASAAYYPDAALTVVVLANRGDVRTEVIERRIARRLLHLPIPRFSAHALSSDARKRYVGDFDIGVFTVHVVDRGDQLWLEMPPPGPTTILRFLGNGEFVSESAPDAYQVHFDLVSDRAKELRLLMGAMHWYGQRMR